MNDFVTALYLSLPLLVSGVLHMAVVRRNAMPYLNRPLSVSLFGANKTWRGMLVMPMMTVTGVALAIALEIKLGWSPRASYAEFVDGDFLRLLGLGSLLGLGYALAELPNSWLKRRMGIPPGKRPEKNKLLFAMLDQADSAVGCVIVLALLMPVPPATLVTLVLIGPVLHLAANLGLFAAGLRKEPV